MHQVTIGVDYSVGDEVWVLRFSRPKLFKATITKSQIVLTTIGLSSDLEVNYWSGSMLLPPNIFPTREAAERALIDRALESGQESSRMR